MKDWLIFLRTATASFTSRSKYHPTKAAGISSTLFGRWTDEPKCRLAVHDGTEGKSGGRRPSTAIELLEELKPAGLNEAQLDVLMFGVQSCAAEFLKRSLIRQQPSELVDSNVNRAVRLVRVFNEQLEAKARLNGKSEPAKSRGRARHRSTWRQSHRWLLCDQLASRGGYQGCG